MQFCFLAGVLLFSSTVFGQITLVYKKARPSQLDMVAYTQIAMGDIVGPAGRKTEQSMDLTDALTARLFNAKTIEVMDNSALEALIGAQQARELQVIDEKTKKLLNMKLSNAILVSGRLRSPTLEQKLIYRDQSTVLNNCSRVYYYQVKGDVSIQLSLFDVRAGKMIYSDILTKAVDKRTKEDCKTPDKLDLGEITRTAIRDLSEEVARLMVPYETETTFVFNNPGLLKGTFKQLKEAVTYLQINNTEAGLAILKNYTESKDIKDKNKDDAWFNYGLALVYTGRHEEAKKALQLSSSLNGANVTATATLFKIMEEEEQVMRKMEAQAIARQKAREEAVNPAAPVEAGGKPGSKTPVKAAAKPKEKKASY